MSETILGGYNNSRNMEGLVSRGGVEYFDSAASDVAEYFIEKLRVAKISPKKYPGHYTLKNWISLNGPERLSEIIFVINTGELTEIDFADHERFLASVKREIARIADELDEQDVSDSNGLAPAS